MQNGNFTAFALTLILAGTPPAVAQNLLPNPELNVNDDSWENGLSPGSSSWSALDSRGCPGSGSLVVPCNFFSQVTSTECMPYSSLPFWAGFDVRGTEELETVADVTVRIEAFNGSECQSNVAFVDEEFESAEVTTTFQRFEAFFPSMPPLTQSVKLHLRVEWTHCAVVSGELLYFDTVYLGTAEPVFAHDFENGSHCPLSRVPSLCGNGIAEAGEECDGADLAGETCSTATGGTHPHGVLACTPGCTLDISGCTP